MFRVSPAAAKLYSTGKLCRFSRAERMERQILAKILKDRPFQLVLQFRKAKSQEMNPFRPSFELLFLYVLLELEASAHK